MAVIARDTYEIVVKGGVETKDLLSAMNALLEEDRKRWADVAKVLGSVETALKGLGQGQREVQQGLGETTSKLLSVDAASNLLVKSWGLVRKAGELLAQPLGLAASFETEVAAIDTISNRAGTKFASTFLDISERLGIDAAQVARAGYEAVGSGVAEASLAQFTEISAELANAGRAEILPTLKLLTTAQNQFKLSLGDVQEAADILFAVTRDGTTTIPELANELGDLIPLGKGAGQTFKEIGASIGALTKGGLSTALAATQLKSLATSFQADLPKIVKGLAELGVKTDEQAFKSLSFVDKISLLSTAFKGNEAAAFKALGRQEAVAAVFALGANNAEFLRAALEGVDKAAGSTDKAVGRMQETTEQTAARLRASFNRELIELGNQLLPRVNEVMTQLTEYIKANGDELAAKIRSGVDSLISLGTFVVDNGPTILTFFGALVAGASIAGVVKLGGAVAGLAGGLNTVATAAGVAKGALGLIMGPVGLLTAALPQLIDLAKELGTSFGNFLASGDQIGNVAQDILNRGAELRVREATGDFGTAEALNAARGQVLAGDALLTDPAALDQIRGEFTAKTSEAFATLQEALALGVDQAQVLVEQNVNALTGAADAQALRQADAIARLENALTAQKAQDAEVERLRFDLGAQLKGTLAEAINRQVEIRREVEQLQTEATFAERKAADFQGAAASLTDRFTALLGQANAPGIVTGPVAPTPPRPRGAGGARGRSVGLDELFGIDQANILRTAEAFAGAAFATIQQQFQVNLDRRTALIADSNQRDLAQLGLRHAREVAASVKAGEDLAALLLLQGQERLEVLRSQEEQAAQVRAQAAADFRTQLDRNQQIEGLILAGTDAGAIIALQNRQETELALVAGSLEAERALREVHERDMTLLIEQQNAARLQTFAGYADSVGGILTGLGDTMRAFGLESKLLAGVEILATAASLEAKAISAFAESGLSFASGNILKGGAQLAAGIAAQAQVVRLVAKAASLGAGGGGGGRGGAAGASGGQRRNPRLESSGRSDGERAGITFVFQGPVYDSQREAEAAFGRQALRGVRRLQDAPRGAPRARISEFES